LWELKLPGEDTRSDDVQRGIAVHDWMAAAHTRAEGRACSASDLPEPGSDQRGLAAGLMDELVYRAVRPYLLQHLAVCPLREPGVTTDVAAEHLATAFDTAADVTVIAKPDLIRRLDGQLVYRELKTSAAMPEMTTSNALSLVPQLALAVCLIADGALGGGCKTADGHISGRIELEILSPSSAKLISFETAGAGVVTTARQVVARLASAWHRDTQFPAAPGPWCAGCPVARWCPDAASPAAPVIVVDGVTIDARTGEVLSTLQGLTSRAEAISGVISEPAPDEDPET
jgi:hypothetical protein